MPTLQQRVLTVRQEVAAGGAWRPWPEPKPSSPSPRPQAGGRFLLMLQGAAGEWRGCVCLFAQPSHPPVVGPDEMMVIRSPSALLTHGSCLLLLPVQEASH